MKIVVSICFVALLLLGVTTPAWAWGPAGHKIVASIAFRQLTVDEQKKIVALISGHPRFMRDFADHMPSNISDEAEKREWLFQQAAIWPDLVKLGSYPEKPRFNRPVWHYINIPYYLRPADQMALESHVHVNTSLVAPAMPDLDMNVVQTIRFARAKLANTQTSAEDKGEMLAWLFHTVGDIHQPLHSSALFSQQMFPHGERGGGAIITVQQSNLHSVWDGFPGANSSFTTIRNKAIGIINDSGFAALNTQASASLDEQTWLDESVDLARNVAYGTEVVNSLRQLEDIHEDTVHNPIDLSQTYLEDGGKAAQRRVTQAGVRLGAILKALAQ